MSGDKKQPVLKLSAGPIKLAAWENDREGKKYFSVSIVRVYKDQNGEWKETSYFGDRDLLIVEALAREAFVMLSVREGDKKGGAAGSPDDPPSGGGSAY